MTSWVKIGGQERPVAFGYAVAYAYEKQTGGNYNELIFTIAREMENVQRAMAENDLLKVAAAMHVGPITDLVFFGMTYAHRRAGMEVDFEASDVAEWLFGDQKALEACVMALFDSLPKPDKDDAKKKIVPGPRTGSTGTILSKRRQQ